MMKFCFTSILALALTPVHSFQIAGSRTGAIRRFHDGPGTVTTKNDLRKHSELSASTTTSAQRSVPIGATDVEIVGNVVFLLPYNAKDVVSKFGSSSPYGNPSIMEACEQLQRKANWFSDGAIEADVVLMPENEQDFNSIKETVVNADALIALNLGSAEDLGFLNDIFRARKSLGRKNTCQYALDCEGDFKPLCASYDLESPSLGTLIPWSYDASSKRMEELMMGLFDRWTSDDFTVSLMLFFNQFSGSSIDWVKYSIDATWEKGIVQNAGELISMATKCGDCITKCVQDEQCKECLDALTAVDTRDQVASYRTLVSYESELLKDFSFCILQKNNIFNCDAQIPEYPKVNPMQTFRGKALTAEVARGILVGHLDDEIALKDSKRTNISWKVAAGANVAYDQFPSQNQIFYESVNKRAMWYDPVFRVETIDGRNVWCKRHYRVRDGPVPGTFRFSVLDNGVTSNEFWTIIDVADDLSHIIFHYAGAAGAVGQRYLGGLLCTADGSLPSESEREPIYEKLRSAGIDPWELFEVDNRDDTPGAISAGPPPLDFYRKDVLQKKQEAKK